MVNTIDDDYRLLERIRRGEGLEPLHDTNCDNSRMRSENDAKRRVMRTDKAFKILKNAAWLGSNEERDAIEEAVTMACNALATIDQITWERDMAISQLRKLGYSLGERLRTEDEPISRRTVIDYLSIVKACVDDGTQQFLDILISHIKNIPVTEPKQKQGLWIKWEAKNHIDQGSECSVCGYHGYFAPRFGFTYCPNCGSKMERGTIDEIN